MTLTWLLLRMSRGCSLGDALTNCNNDDNAQGL